MSAQQTYPKLRLVAPQGLVAKAGFTPTDIEWMRSLTSAEEFVETLKAKHRLSDLCTAIAYMLPKREAVWTACLWAKLAEERYGAPRSRALRAAEVWVRDQSEEARYKAFEFAQAEALDRPGAWAGQAAFFSGRSLAPPAAEAVIPDSGLAPLAITIVHTLTLAGNKDAQAGTALAALALDVAAGQNGLERLASLIDAQPAHVASPEQAAPPAAGA